MIKQRQLSQSKLILTTVDSDVTRDATFHKWRFLGLIPCALVFTLWNLSGVATIENPILVTTSDHNERMLYEYETPLGPDRTKINGPVIDVISIGSLLKAEFQDAQERTFGRATEVRHFFRITEHNDTDSTCFTELTTDQMAHIINFCSKTEHQSFISHTLRERLFTPKKHAGWMCAQKRPLDGLYQVLQRYVNGEDSIPDYLFIIDDDTYINMGRLLPDLMQHFPPDQPFAVAGCNFDFLTESGITFPYGGYGSYLTKKSIQRLIQPFYCDGRDEHSNLACWRLNINALGEKQFYQDGMSVSDLMQSYGANLKLTNVDQWTETGYCLHSDHALAYFINFYHITVPDGTLSPQERPKDKIRRKYGYVAISGENECQHERDQCTPDHRICHYIIPTQMDQLYGANSSNHVFATKQPE